MYTANDLFHTEMITLLTVSIEMNLFSLSSFVLNTRLLSQSLQASETDKTRAT